MAEQLIARLADKEADYKRYGITKKPSYKEDGMRTNGGKGTFEWWYTDVTFKDGTAVVVIFFTKNYFDTRAPHGPRPTSRLSIRRASVPMCGPMAKKARRLTRRRAYAM